MAAAPRAVTGGAALVAAQLTIGNIGTGNTSTLTTFSCYLGSWDFSILLPLRGSGALAAFAWGERHSVRN